MINVGVKNSRQDFLWLKLILPARWEPLLDNRRGYGEDLPVRLRGQPTMSKPYILQLGYWYVKLAEKEVNT